MIDSVSHNLACQMLILMLHFLSLPQDKQKEQHFSCNMNEALQQSVQSITSSRWKDRE